MSKISKAKNKEKRVRVPAEYTEGALHFKTDGDRNVHGI